ncbi:MAG TPA: hypothetical protein PLX79_01215 [Candidatus Dojkabacteria bacterium]|nr:hypothetical protein [Candidatus Dojkabacteria bacterium]
MNYIAKSRKYYENRYDLYTIQLCLQTLQPETDVPLPNQELMPPDTVNSIKENFAELINYFKAGERYRSRQETIDKWIAEDQSKEDYFNKALDPSPVLCNKCYKTMRLIDKDLFDFLDKPLRVLFMFECPTCNCRKAIYDNGEEYKSENKICPKCKSNLNTKSIKKKKIISVVSTCTSCDYKDKYEIDLNVDSSKYEKEELQNKILLEKYREKYCLTPEAGQEYIISSNRTKDYLNHRSEEQVKATDPVWQKVKEIKKLSILEIETNLVKALEPLKYIRFSLDKPEIEKFLTVKFSVQEADLSRSEYDSVHKLQKAIKSVLEDTNWRLMSEGISYRLGYLTGRLKGYEREDDLHELLKRTNS